MQNNDGLNTRRKQWLQEYQAVTRVFTIYMENWKFRMEIQMVDMLFSQHIKFYSLILLHKISIRPVCVNSKHPRLSNVWETSAENPYWWRVITQIWVVLLIGWSKFHKQHDQSEAVPWSG